MSKKISQLPALQIPGAGYFPAAIAGTTYRFPVPVDPALLSIDAAAGATNVAAIDAAIVAANAASVALTGPVEVLLPAGRFYMSGKFAARSNVTVRGAGLGKTVLYMPAAAYPNAVSQGYLTTPDTSVLVSALGGLVGPYTPLINFSLEALTIESQVSDGRYLYPIVARNAQNLRIRDVEVFGISIGNCITLDTVIGGEVSGCYLHDCTSATAGALQLSGIETDGNRVNSTNSRSLDIHDNWIEDLTMTGAALPTPNMQTDGINLGVGNNHGHTVHANHIRNVGEGIDCFSSECTIYGNHLDDCANGALKFIHGASRNNAYGNSIMRPGFAGIYLGGSNTAIVADNYIHDNTIESVNQAGTYPLGYGIKIDYVAQTFKPARNTIARNKFVGDTSNLDIVVRQDDGTDNRYIDNEADGWVLKYSDISAGTATVINAKKTLVRAGLSGTEPTVSGVEKIVQWGDEEIDTQSEYDPSTYIFTATSHRRLSIQAVLRIVAGAAESWTLRIKKNGAVRTEVLSYSGGNPSQIRIHDAFSVAPGDTVAVYVFQANGARDCGGGSNGSYLTIEEVAC